MLGRRKLIVDTFAEVYHLLEQYKDDEFWDFESHEPVQDAVYLLGRRQFSLNVPKIRSLVEQDFCKILISNPTEGSETMKGQCNYMGIMDLVEANKILIIGGGDMDPDFSCLQYDGFLAKILQFDYNQQSVSRSDEIYAKTSKPYKFLFLNGRMRPHRKYLLERFRLNGLLDSSLWSCLDARDGVSRKIAFDVDGQNLMHAVRPVKFLPKEYEVEMYAEHMSQPMPSKSFVKDHLFNKEWGDIYIKPEQYIDTYFSVVTETVFEYPYSFRTEKIWKPIAMAHPWIAVANAGFYRDMHNLGFRSFGHLIDESFDSIHNCQHRIERLAQVIEDLCQQDLPAFLAAAQEVCKYNQQHLEHMRHKVAQDFPQRFFDFMRKHGYYE